MLLQLKRFEKEDCSVTLWFRPISKDFLIGMGYETYLFESRVSAEETYNKIKSILN